MKISSLTICNFRNYQGEHTVDFHSSDPKRNMVLIGGFNGAGKTTLFDAIKLCMFGYQYDGVPLAKSQYEQYIRSCWNNKAAQEHDRRYYLSMEIVLDDFQPVYTITLRRTWDAYDNSFREDFLILRDGHAFEIVEKEDWQQYIYDLFPPYTLDYFFFDGERMRELVVGDRAEDLLRNSARDLIGLKIYDTLLSDITVLKSKIKKGTKKKGKNKEEYAFLSSRVNEDQNQLIVLNTKRDGLRERVSSLDMQMEKLREEIHRKSGAFAKSHDEYKIKIEKLEAKLLELNNEIAKTCEYVPFIMAFPLLNQAFDQLKMERMVRESANNGEVVENVRSRLVTSFEMNKSVLKQINAVLDDFKNYIDTASTTPFIHDVSNATMIHLAEMRSSIRSERKQMFQDLLKEREKADIELQKLIQAQKRMPEAVYVETELKEIEQLKRNIYSCCIQIENISMEIGKVQSQFDDGIRRLDDIDSSELKLVEERGKYAFCERLEAVLQDYISYILARKVQHLEDAISEMYHYLENKDDLVDEIKIDPTTFAIALYGFGGEIVNKKTLSAGEKEIFALSVLWGLSTLSTYHLPVVVDSLLARLDQSHVDKVGGYFLPKAGKQVIVLSHDREVDVHMHRMLLPHISHEYVLSYDQKHKISPGYFPRCM